jgi:hypothetical protein
MLAYLNKIVKGNQATHPKTQKERGTKKKTRKRNGK